MSASENELKALQTTIYSTKKWTLNKCKSTFRQLNQYQLQYVKENNGQENPLINYYISFISNEYKVVSQVQGYILTWVATVMLPLSIVVGYFGMKFRSMKNGIYRIKHAHRFVLGILATSTVLSVLFFYLFLSFYY